MSATVVVPCFNEQHRLQRKEFLEFAWRTQDVRILFVNDGSTDGTQDMLDMLAAAVPDRIDVLGLPRNRGKAEAVRHGILASMDHGAELVGYWDADLATPLPLIPEFLSVLRRHEEVNVVLGSRLSLLGRRIQRNPRRKALGHCFAAVASRVLGYPVVDTQCGAKFFRVTPELRMAVQHPFHSRWIFDVELLHRLRRMEDATPQEFCRQLFELPLMEWQEVGNSRLKLRDFLRAPWELLRIALSAPEPVPEPVLADTEPRLRVSLNVESETSQRKAA